MEPETNAGRGGQGAAAWLPGVLLACVAAALYAHSMPAGAFPGKPANVTAEACGLAPHLRPAAPLYMAVAGAVTAAQPARAGVVLNMFSVACGALGLGLIYVLVHFVLRLLVEQRAEGRSYAWLPPLAALASAGYAGFSAAYWVSATRASPILFALDIALLLGVLVVLYARTGARALPPLVAFLFASATVEFSTLYVLFPLYASALLGAMYRRQALTLRSGLLLLACLPAGLWSHAWAVAAFSGGEGYALREFRHAGQVLWLLWTGQYLQIAAGLPRVGWLLLLCLTVIPWVTAAVVAWGSVWGRRTWDNLLLHVVLTALVVLLALNVKGTPWYYLGTAHVVVTPYVLCGSVFGYLLVYWALLPAHWWWGINKTKGMVRMQATATGLATALLLGFAFAGPYINRSVAAANEESAVVTGFVDSVVSHLDGRTWLLTDGSLDENLLVRAKERGIELRALNLRLGTSEVYLRHVAGQFESPTLKNLASVGLVPMLQGWFALDETVPDRLAALAGLDLFTAAGMTLVPNGPVFLAVKPGADPDIEAAIDRNAAFWGTARAWLGASAPAGEDGEGMARYVARHLSHAANHLGTVLEDHGRENEAWDAYGQARAFDAGNLPALLNQRAMVARGYRTGEAEALDAQVRALTEGREETLDLWSMSRAYGYIRTPAVFARMGWAWARTGQPQLAAAGLQRAMDLAPQEDHAQVKQALADVYFAQRQDAESEALLKELLVANPVDTRALVAMAKLEARRGRFDEALALADKAAAAGMAGAGLAPERAAILCVAGRTAEARALLEATLKEDSGNVRAWEVLLHALTDQQDPDGLEKLAADMRGTRIENSPIPLLAEARALVLRRRWLDARDVYMRLLDRGAADRGVLESLVRIDLLLGRVRDAGANARRLLRIDPGNAIGNYVMGSLQLSEGEWELAEDSLRRSLAAGRTFLAVNDLAWLVFQRGGFEEAEALAREAIRLRPRRYQPWDTLGSILARTRRHADACEAFEKALELQPRDPNVHVNYAGLLADMGEWEKAGHLLATAEGMRDKLSAENQTRLIELRSRLRHAGRAD